MNPLEDKKVSYLQNLFGGKTIEYIGHIGNEENPHYAGDTMFLQFTDGVQLVISTDHDELYLDNEQIRQDEIAASQIRWERRRNAVLAQIEREAAQGLI